MSRIRPDPTQPRKNVGDEKHRELTASVRRLGVLQPITVRFLQAENIYQIISGERRYQAAKAAALTEIPCWVQTPKNEDILLHQIVENWQRADLEPFELAEALAVLRDANGYSQKQMAEATSKPESEISRLLSLLKLEPEVQQKAQQSAPGTFTKRHLQAIARLPKENQQEVMIDVQKRKLTALETERDVKERKDKASGKKTRGAPPSHVRRFNTSVATVTVTSRKKQVSEEEILAALDEVRAQIADNNRRQ